jgi:hypothetical protein
VKFPTITPSAPCSNTMTSSTVVAIVSRTFARLAATNAVERSSTRKSAVSCS